MQNSFDQTFNDYYEKAKQLNEEVGKTLLERCKNLNTVLGDEALVNENISSVNNCAQQEFANQASKLMRNTKHCVIIGDTNVGKSSFLNSFVFQSDVLATGSKHTTTCFTEIQHSEEENYVLVDNKIKKFSEFKNIIKSNAYKGKNVKLFYNCDDNHLLRKNVVLFDTPGFDWDKNVEKKIINLCNDADVIVLIINTTTSITNNLKSFCEKFQNKLSKLDVFVLFNYWDIVEEKEDSDETKQNFIENIELLLNNLERRKIFFISILEQIYLNTKDERIKRYPGWENRNKTFLRFKDNLEIDLEENSFKRKHKCIVSLMENIKTNLLACESILKFLQKNLNTLSCNYVDILSRINDFDIVLRKKIKLLFDQAYFEFKDNAFKLIKNKTFEENDNDKNSNSDFNNSTEKEPLLEINLDDLDNNFETLIDNKNENENLMENKIKDILNDILNKKNHCLKNEMKEHIEKITDEHTRDQIKFIIDNLYFSLILDKKFVLHFDNLYKYLLKIKNYKAIATGLIIASSTLVCAAVIGTTTTLAPILAPAEIAAGIIIAMGFGGGAGGGLVGGISSTLIINKTKLKISNFLKNFEKPLSEPWEAMKNDVNESFNNFVIDMETPLHTFINHLLVDVDKIRSKLNNLINELETKTTMIVNNSNKQ